MYQPAEDSYFILEVLKDFLKNKDKNIRILDMGSGSGIISETCLNLGFRNITVADIDKETCRFLKEKFKNNIKIKNTMRHHGLKAVVCDRRSCLGCSRNDRTLKCAVLIKFLDILKSNLFSKIQGKFDLMIFNPPYLPEDKHDKKKDTTAGKKGYELIIKFIKQAKSHLSKQGEVLLLFSSFSKPEKILEQACKLKYNYQLLAEKSLFFEKLFIYRLY